MLRFPLSPPLFIGFRSVDLPSSPLLIVCRIPTTANHLANLQVHIIQCTTILRTYIYNVLFQPFSRCPGLQLPSLLPGASLLVTKAAIEAEPQKGTIEARPNHSGSSSSADTAQRYMVVLPRPQSPQTMPAAALATLLAASVLPVATSQAPNGGQPGQLVVERVDQLGWGVSGWRGEPRRSGLPLGARPQDWRRRATAAQEWLWSPEALALGVRREAVKYQGTWFNGTGFGIPDYMGDGRYGTGAGSALTVIGSSLSAALLGLPLPKPEFLASARGYVCPNGVVMDNPCGSGLPAVGTFWYTLVNQAFFVGLTARAPELDPSLSILRTAADSWHAAAKVMAANRSAGFDHTGFDFSKMAPVDNGLWKEPDSAGGIGPTKTFTINSNLLLRDRPCMRNTSLFDWTTRTGESSLHYHTPNNPRLQ